MFFGRYTRLISMLALIVFSVATVSAGNTGSVLTKGNVHYLSNEVVFKWKDAAAPKAASPAALAQAAVDKFSAFGAVASGPLFPGASYEARSLHGIYSLRYDAELDPAAVIAKMKNDPAIEWIEPRFAYPVSETPNDEYYSNQPYMPQIQAPAAWDVVKGDGSLVIAITDTGFDWDHPDLSGAVWMNRDETAGNGVDDDNNGYIDDIRGWDFGGDDGTPDNDPMEDAPDHGTHVAGLAGAVTNNQVGIASAAYNVQLMALKTSRDNYRDFTTGNPYVLFGYEAIVYAADNGADIINCSWGSGGYSIAGAEAVAYAIEKGCVIVGAAGNENISDPHYPSSYPGVLSVASVSSGDKKSSFSNYGADVDVAAPGSFIYSTWQDDTYLNISGTSMASPIVSSVAALVMTRFPEYTNHQVVEQIRATADDISFENPMFENLLGRGRVNAYRAVTETNVVSVRPENVVFSDAVTGNDDNIFSQGETIAITADFLNYLAPTQNLQVTLEGLGGVDEHVTLGTTSFQAGGIGTLGSTSNAANPFTFTIKDDVPENVRLRFLLRLTDGSYEDVAIIETTGNPSYATQKGNNIALTITSQGTIGYNDYSSNQQGDGFTWNDGQNMLFEGSLIIANSESNVIDHARGTDQSEQNLDFRPVTPFTIASPGSRADIQGSTVFDDSGDFDPLDIEVELNSYSFTDDEYEDFIILEYVITNKSRQAIEGLYAGLFCDWDLTGGDGDIIGYDADNEFGFVRNTDRNFDTMVGNALISDENYNFYALMNDGSGDGFGIYDGFSDSEKFTGVSSGLTYVNAGEGDVSMITSSGPHSILISGELTVAFVLTAAEGIEALGQKVLTARQKYQDLLTSVDDDAPAAPLSFALDQNYPNPFNPATSISYTIAEAADVTLFVYDLLGRKVAELVNGYQQPGSYQAEFTGASLASGVYFYELRAGAKRDLKKMLLMK